MHDAHVTHAIRDGILGRACTRFAHALAEDTRRQVLGPATPGFDFMERLRCTLVLLASSFIPVYMGLKPVEYAGQVSGTGVVRARDA
ncbi:hypothetical protein I79_025093 [Cricetulus griseus]|uniref:Uncharacterized protein n=1 Tax=Cricetulus griseus TaxID=10029 RepID=G3IMF4_CRIGR|nr:hypothetical protein I79_025093 [Cricetulus griseus]